MKYPERRIIRLDKELYQGPITAIATICFYNRYNVIEADFADEIIFTLNDLCDKYSLRHLVYCLMPDHLHMVTELLNDSSNFFDVVSYFKRKVSLRLKGKHSNKQLWQDRFIDRIIRNEKELIKMCRYVLENPVRRGLVDDFRKWPYSSGYYFDMWK